MSHTTRKDVISYSMSSDSVIGGCTLYKNPWGGIMWNDERSRSVVLKRDGEFAGVRNLMNFVLNGKLLSELNTRIPFVHKLNNYWRRYNNTDHTFCKKEPLFLAHFRNNIWIIGFPMQRCAFIEEPEIVVPYCNDFSRRVYFCIFSHTRKNCKKSCQISCLSTLRWGDRKFAYECFIFGMVPKTFWTHSNCDVIQIRGHNYSFFSRLCYTHNLILGIESYEVGIKKSDPCEH